MSGPKFKLNRVCGGGCATLAPSLAQHCTITISLQNLLKSVSSRLFPALRTHLHLRRPYPETVSSWHLMSLNPMSNFTKPKSSLCPTYVQAAHPWPAHSHLLATAVKPLEMGLLSLSTPILAYLRSAKCKATTTCTTTPLRSLADPGCVAPFLFLALLSFSPQWRF